MVEWSGSVTASKRSKRGSKAARHLATRSSAPMASSTSVYAKTTTGLLYYTKSVIPVGQDGACLLDDSKGIIEFVGGQKIGCVCLPYFWHLPEMGNALFEGKDDP